MALRRTLLSTTTLSGVLLGSPLAMAADVITKTPAYQATAPWQAVDGVNGKIEGFGGTFADHSLYGAKGSLSIPLGTQFGFQIDGAAGEFSNRFFGSAGGHLFWRNPTQGLLGIYGNYTHWDQLGGLHVSQVAGEGEAYFGRWTLQAIAGVEFGNKVTTATPTQFVGGPGTLFSTFEVKTRFFDQVNLAYYPSDDLKLFIGHRYIGGTNAFAAGGEWAIPTGSSTVASFFVEGRVGEDDYRGVWGGMKFYFGQKDKSLIRRHREDDPINWSPDSLFSLVKALKSQTSIGVCTDPNEIFLNGECRARLISDIRLKRDIVLLARLANGIGLYSYRYLWSDIVYVGVIAQEVLPIVPEAILMAADGYFRVDYVRLGLRLLRWDEWVAVNAEEVSRAA